MSIIFWYIAHHYKIDASDRIKYVGELLGVKRSVLPQEREMRKDGLGQITTYSLPKGG